MSDLTEDVGGGCGPYWTIDDEMDERRRMENDSINLEGDTRPSSYCECGEWIDNVRVGGGWFKFAHWSTELHKCR